VGSSVIVTVHRYYQCDQSKDVSYSMHGENEKCIKNFGWKRDHMEDLGIMQGCY
jgi:hypothetical protein